MNFRRSDFDVTNRINTTDPVCVKLEIERIFRALYSRPRPIVLNRAFDDMVRLYRGEFPGYSRCDTAYHDLQHSLEVTLAMVRLLDGYERSRADGPAIPERLFQLGAICALFHDMGYIRKLTDTKHRNGAEYTTTHVSRGARFLREYLPTIGMEEYAEVAGQIVHFTGYERPVSSIRVPDPIFKLVGSLLGSADIIAQMSDRCYLEKCRDRLYPEFVLGKLGGFSSAEDLVLKTPRFYEGACRRLDEKLGRSYEYAARYFGGANLYLDEMRKNIDYAQVVAKSGEVAQRLRRRPPKTLVGL
jgi:hypothetical protein